MNDSLPQLEAQKSDLLRQFAAVGDLRRGSIIATSGKCSKPNCRCAKRGDPGHGPNFRLTGRVAGTTTTETFNSPAALRKAEQEVAEFHRFQKLSGEVVEVSEKICVLRQVEETLAPEGKKTAAAIHAEVAPEVTTLLGRVFAQRKKTGDLDLEAVEMAFRAPCIRLAQRPSVSCCSSPSRPAHHPLPMQQSGALLRTALAAHSHCSGRSGTDAPWYLCRRCPNGQFPVDRQLDVENRDCSPGVGRMDAIVGQQGPFDRGREQMKVLAGLEVTAKSVSARRKPSEPSSPPASSGESAKPSN